MKLGINTLFYIPGEVGGTETYLVEMLRVWKRDAAPREVVLFTQNENHERLETEFGGGGWRCEKLNFSAAARVVRIVREQLELPGRVRRAGVDVLWSPGYTLPLRAACPQAVTIHDMQYKSFPQDLSWTARFVTNFLVQQGCKRAQGVLTISEFSRGEILKYTRATPEQTWVVLAAASAEFSQANHDHPSDSPPYILCIANTYPHKNVEQIVRAFALLEGRLPHRLHLVGRPRRGEAAVEAALSTVKDPSRVLRKSGLSESELVAEYQGAEVFVFPSLYEGFGLPVLEAMMVGVPVVTTRCGSIPEVGGDGVCYYDLSSDQHLADALERVLKMTAAERMELLEQAARQAAKFTWDRSAQQLWQLLQDMTTAGVEAGPPGALVPD